jgi:Vacuolar segregation subunit 7
LNETDLSSRPGSNRLLANGDDNADKTTKVTATESGSESGKDKDTRASRKPGMASLQPAAKPAHLQPRRSATHLNNRNKAASEISVNNMTVETETVSTVPDVSLIADREGPGTLRARLSTETIRPKKERKRVRKTPSITSGPCESPPRKKGGEFFLSCVDYC